MTLPPPTPNSKSEPHPRDTDADWRKIGASEPYWGVLTHPDFLRQNLDAGGVEAFYATGQVDMAYVAARLAQLAGGPLAVDSALDFGCGAGRLAEAMATYAGRVTGYDISPGMLQAARQRAHPNITYVSDLPPGPFAWINSWLVFQHIPPQRGLALLDQLLDRLAPGGLISLHFTIYSEADHLRPADQPLGTVTMYDYDLGEVVRRMHRHGLDRLVMDRRDHGPVQAVIVFARHES